MPGKYNLQNPVNLSHSSILIQITNLLIKITFRQVPGAELGEGGSVVDLSHIAPSVLALIQVIISTATIVLFLSPKIT